MGSYFYFTYISSPPPPPAPPSARRIGSCLKTEKGKKEKFKIIPSVGEEEEREVRGKEAAPRGAPGVHPLPRKRRGQRLEPGGRGRWAEGAGASSCRPPSCPLPVIRGDKSAVKEPDFQFTDNDSCMKIDRGASLPPLARPPWRSPPRRGFPAARTDGRTDGHRLATPAWVTRPTPPAPSAGWGGTPLR